MGHPRARERVWGLFFGKLIELQSLCPHLYGPACKSIEAKD
jgi:hypothetical protein